MKEIAFLLQDHETQKSLTEACPPHCDLHITYYTDPAALLKIFAVEQGASTSGIPFAVVIDLRVEALDLTNICSTMRKVAPDMLIYAYNSNSERVSDMCFKSGVSGCFKGGQLADLLTTITLLD